MARRRRRRSHRSGGFRLPIAVLAGAGAGMVQPIEKAIAGQITGDDGALAWVTYNYTGLRKAGGQYIFDSNGLKNGMLPLFFGVLIHKAAGMLGINRALGQAKVPIFRV